MPVGLITGFEPFAGLPTSPASAVLPHLDGETVAGRRLAAAQVPVSMARLPGVLAELVAAHDPAFVIALGLARGAAVIRVEAMAVNAAALTVTDNDGAGADGRPIDPAGPAGRAATWDAAAVAAAIGEAGVPARVSWHAGTHLCNFALYTLAGLLERAGRPVPCGFLHLPFMPEQVIWLMRRHVEETGAAVGAALDEPSMSLDTQLAAVRAAVAATARHAAGLRGD